MANKGKLQLLLQLYLFLSWFLCWAPASYADTPDDSTVIQDETVVDDKTVVQNNTAVHDKTVVYDETTGLISIHAENASLKALLAKISHHTNVKFFMDPAAEQVVSVSLEKKPLDKGLKLIMRNAGLSHATIYGKNHTKSQPQKIVPISMKILPKGKKDTASLVPVTPASYKPAKNTPRSIFDITDQDFKDMPEEKAKNIRERLEILKERRSKRATKHEKKKAEQKLKGAERKQKKEKHTARTPDREDAPGDSESDPGSELDSDAE